jgi:hypothetical protein
MILLLGGCVTTGGPDISGIMEGLLGELMEVPSLEDERAGWTVLDDDGKGWAYYADNEIVARCVCTYVKYNGVERWRGTYLNIKTPSGKVLTKTTNSLAECTRWVDMFLYGDKYI